MAAQFGTSTRPLARALQQLDIEHRRIRRSFAQTLGISRSEFDAFMMISEVDGVTPKHLAEQLNITTGSMTAMTDRLEATGLITRVPNPTDRRSLLLRLTPSGDIAREMVDQRYLEAIDSVANSTPSAQTGAAVDLLQVLAEAIGGAGRALERAEPVLT